MADRRGLGVDAGGAATRWALVDGAGAPVARGEVPPFNGHVFTDPARAAAVAAIRAIAAALPAGQKPDAVAAGITGLPRGSAEAGFFAEAFAAAFGLGSGAVAIHDDLVIAYRARFRPGEGVLVQAGTGAIGFHLTAGGEEVRAGGYGAIVDDAGAAYWIAVRALRCVLRAEDERPGAGWATPLGRELETGIGSAEWREVRAFVYAADRGRIGLLARRAAAAADAGDEAALAIFAEAGRELARLGGALRRRLGPLPVALAGGATRLHPALAQAFGAALGDVFTHDEIDASLAAARMALASPLPQAGEA